MKTLWIAFLLVIALNPVFGEEGPWIKFVPDLRFWGAALRIEYADFFLIPQGLTSFEIELGGGYEEFGYYLYPDNSLYVPPVSSAEGNSALYQNINFDWGLGFRQGFFYDSRKKDNLLEAHVLLRGGFDYNLPDYGPGSLIYQSGRSDARGNIVNSLALGVFYDSVYRNPHEAVQGFSVDVTGEWAPLFLVNEVIGRNDFQRLSVDVRGFLTVLDLENAGNSALNRFNIYFGNRVIFDALFGAAIPILTRQSVGGRELSFESALGGVVRGIASRRFDSYLKLVNNFDVRINLPCFEYFSVALQPGCVVYFDSAFIDAMDYSINFNEIYNSAGLGFFLTLPWLDLILSLDYFINENKIDISYGFSFQF
ncbi:MAG: hypothetical protein JXR70_08380 [Spirochaetales bacterium]|nr:hypothetical protein [Spirochaetales bacterium]